MSELGVATSFHAYEPYLYVKGPKESKPSYFQHIVNCGYQILLKMKIESFFFLVYANVHICVEFAYRISFYCMTIMCNF
jgi:hypothetical protein